MPHCGIQLSDSTSCRPATPSRNCPRMPSETMKVATEASSPKPLMALAALFGKSSRSTAAAIGSQRVMERRLVIASPSGIGSRRWGVGEREERRPKAGALSGTRRLPASRSRSCQHPQENDHAEKEHQRVIPDVAGLEEAEQVSDGGDEG